MAETPARNSYQPLARKYRPMEFSELVGQDSVATALANAIRIGREPHGVIFSGVRGIGKTTIARLYAKALNCEKGPTPEPCGKCGSCTAITLGTHEDVLEIDGASNTGVDDVRALRETVGYVPMRSKFKVYIIDEVHMLSQSAFNALLKTLEEPPRHVVFVFATTEVHRIPATIVGRCQVFNLRKMNIRDITTRLEKVLTLEKISFEIKALQVIAREGHGSMRDALTLLDQVIALGGGRVTTAVLKDLVVSVSSTVYLEMLEALITKDGSRFIKLVDTVDNLGVQFAGVVEELAQIARHAFIIRDVGTTALNLEYLHLDDEELSRLAGLGQLASPFDLNRIFRTLVKSRSDMDGSAMDRFVFENYGLEWCLDPGLPDFDSVQEGAKKSFSSAPQASFSSQSGSTVTPDSAPPSIKAHDVDEVASRAPVAKGSLLGAFNEMMAAETKNKRAGATAASGAVSVTTEFKKETADIIRPMEKAEPPVLKSGATAAQFPASWRELVDIWKRLKPLQARKLEEAHPLEYSAKKILIAIPSHSLAASSLLHREEQTKIREIFLELFGFDGVLEISTLVTPVKEDEAAHFVKNELSLSTETPEPELKLQASSVIPDSILQERAREVANERERVIESAKTSPMTKEALAILGGKVEDVRITDSTISAD